MRVPIPDDWDGEKWVCYQIQWPKSDKWTGILLGLLSYPMRGRFWDERTGSITSVQSIGWDIWSKSGNLLPCADNGGDSGGVDNGATSPCTGISEGDGGEGLDDEGGCDVPSVSWLAIENGILYMYFGPCCKIAVGSFDDLESGAGRDLPDDFWDGGDPGSATYSACGKAYAVQAVVNKIIEASFSALGENPWSMISYVQNVVGYDLDNNWLAALIADVGIGAALGDDWASNYDAIEQQRILCKLVTLFAADGAGVPTSAAFEEIKQIFKSEIYPLPKWQYWDQAINALGRSDMDTVAKLGATDSSRDCACPPEQYLVDFGADLEWSQVWDFRVELPTSYVWRGSNSQQTLGVGLWSCPGATDDFTQTEIEINLLNNNNGPSSVKRIAMVFQTRGDENWDDSQHSGLATEDNVTFPNALLVADLIAAVGENPATAGIWTLQKTVNWAVGGTEPDVVKVALRAYHPPDNNNPCESQYSCVIIAAGLAGTGVNPFVAP